MTNQVRLYILHRLETILPAEVRGAPTERDRGSVNIIDPDRFVIGGEITAAWDLIERTVRAALAERALTPAASATDIVIVSAEEHPRRRGAAMLVAAPAFAAPVMA